MKPLSQRLKPFERRVRIVRAWRGLAVGACFGALASTVWSVLDWRGIAYAEAPQLAVVVAIASLAGAMIGFLRRVPEAALTASIDRRAGLEDRLTTAKERATDSDAFDSALREDAEAKLGTLRPTEVYPIRVSRWHGGALALCAASAAIFLLGNTPFLLSDSAKKEREELRQEGKRIERITKEHLESPEAKKLLTDSERKLADELRKLQRDLEKAHISKEESLQKANEIAKKADEIMKQNALETMKNLETAQSALEKMQKAALKEAGMPNADPQLASLPSPQLQQMEDAAKAQLEKAKNDLRSLKSQLDAIKEKLKNPNLTAAERKALEEQKSALESKMKDAEKAAKDAESQLEMIQLSKEAQEVIRKMTEHPLYKELQEIAKKLAENAQAASQPGGRPKLTKEEREELQRQLEELAMSLKDDEAMQAYLEALKEAMQNAGGT